MRWKSTRPRTVNTPRLFEVSQLRALDMSKAVPAHAVYKIAARCHRHGAF